MCRLPRRILTDRTVLDIENGATPARRLDHARHQNRTDGIVTDEPVPFNELAHADVFELARHRVPPEVLMDPRGVVAPIWVIRQGLTRSPWRTRDRPPRRPPVSLIGPLG